MSSMLDGLNEAQKKAVVTTEGPILVVAGPGTGKTLTIVRRIAHLVGRGVDPKSILAVTFTNRAAREMKERTEAILGGRASGIFIGTFHLLGLSMIRGVRGAGFALLNRDGQIELLKPLVGGSAKKAQQAGEEISRFKNCLNAADEPMPVVWDAYQKELAERHVLDFDDLIGVPAELLEGGGAKEFRSRFRHIIVDEYQDINPAQFRLLRLLCENTKDVCVVGDPDQAIYAFRGADLRNFLNFEKDFSGATRITLSQNYRSQASIVQAADHMIRHNRERIEKDVRPVREDGNRIAVLSVPDERAEGDLIVRGVEERMGGTSHHEMRQGRGKKESGSFSFSDFAVIFRTNAQARIIEEAFSASGIPYQVIGRKNSAQSKEMEDTVAYLRSLSRAGAEDAPPDGADESGLLTAADLFDPRANAVALMTVHMAKGLEFPVVFVAGCEDGLIPCTIMKDGVDTGEERRLFYVAMTRAKDELILLHARRRFLYGQRTAPQPSPFLKEIPGPLIEAIVIPDRVKKEKEPDRQMGLF